MTEAIRIEPENADAYLFRGRAYQGRNGAGDIDAAINDFTTAIEIVPKDYEAYYSRSIAYRDRSDATQSEEDAALSRADHIKARELDPSVADTYATLPDFTAPVEGEIPPALEPEASTEKTAPERESPFDARRRISSAAAAASRGERSTLLQGEDAVGFGSSRRLAGETDEPRGQQDDNSKSNDKPPGLRRRIYPDTPPAAQSQTDSGLPPDNPIRGVPPTLSPLTRSPNSSAPRLTPTPTGPVPNRGGTLPPVGTSPFATPSPSALPGGATGPGGAAGIGARRRFKELRLLVRRSSRPSKRRFPRRPCQAARRQPASSRRERCRPSRPAANNSGRR